MKYAPISRIVLRYVVGIIVGMDAGEMLAGDPDVVTIGALALGSIIEAIYAMAVRKGWAR